MNAMEKVTRELACEFAHAPRGDASLHGLQIADSRKGGRAGMTTEESERLETGGRDEPGDEQGLQLACDERLSRRSVEILHDLGLSQEKIVAYNLRFPTPTPGHRPPASRMRR